MPNLHPTTRLFIQATSLLFAIGGIATLLISDSEPAAPSYAASDANNNLRVVNNVNRQLSINLDPKTTQLKAPSFPITPEHPLTINVYVAHRQQRHESRFFETDTTTKYGTGRVQYNVIEHGKHKPTSDTGPCIAIGHHKGKRWAQSDFDILQKNYPNCKYMNTNDEKCEAPDNFNFRQYYSQKKTGHYIPLALRFDTWNSFQNIKGDPNFAMKLPSQRKYAFNSMLSLSTNWERQDLAKILERGEKHTSLNNFVALTNHWTPRFDTEEYIKVLLDSTFTLNPTGHNPECFRLYETIEAGSIPIMVKGNWRKCENAMKYWYEAPMLYLDSWEELYPTVASLMENPAKLDEMYINLRNWYDQFMGRTIQNIEDYMIESYFGNAAIAAQKEG